MRIRNSEGMRITGPDPVGKGSLRSSIYWLTFHANFVTMYGLKIWLIGRLSKNNSKQGWHRLLDSTKSEELGKREEATADVWISR